jgi:hypothetical protein
MLRSNLLLRSPLLWKRSIVTVAHYSPNHGKGLLLPSRPSHRQLLAVTLKRSSPQQQTCRRALAASPDNGAASKKEPPSSGGDKTKAEETTADNSKTAGEDSKEIVLTPGETVVAVTRLGMWGGIFAFACVCGYFIVKELLPTYVIKCQ